MDKSTQMFRLMAEYDQGHLDRSSFCKSKGISLAKFGYWRTKWLQSQSLSKDSSAYQDKFVAFSPPETAALVSGTCTLIYPNGIRLELPEIDIKLIKLLLDV